jgi:hypothetical protein
MHDYEKLGAFYLGKLYDHARQSVADDLLLYDAKDLTTHAVCVGMTGSGKTGLCVSLLEEAAIDGIPTIAIDPKGDLGNLLLTFPKLDAASFRPWIDPAEAARKNLEPDAYAADRAELWRNGLAGWGQDGERIARFRQAADVAIYTPGSSSGLPLQVLRSLTVPPDAILEDADALRERVSALVSGLLALVGVDADPVQSREHILLTNIIDRSWRAGRDLDLGGLISAIQQPTFEKLGVMDLEAFFPAKDRFKLAMTLNNLLASPAFAAWLTGEPLDVGNLLFTPAGKPRIAILSIAHLSDAERMFFVTLLLNEVVAWMRAQAGTGSLRAILYMDEIFGYFPPTANPPSKTPMLTLLKQARAYGLGVVLATQNPADLDYKGLANTGTWFIGRLQTERDKLRLLDGLDVASASATFDRKALESLLSSLDSRVFLMNNVHDDAPALFHTRWALSYLRGPLTRKQIQDLMADRKAATIPEPAPATKPAALTKSPATPPAGASTAPPLPPGIDQHYLPLAHDPPAGASVIYEPALLGSGRIHFIRRTADVDAWHDVALLAPLEDDPPADLWASADALENPKPAIARDRAVAGVYRDPPAPARRKTSYTSWRKGFVHHLYCNRRVRVLRCRELKQYSAADEPEAAFRARLRHALHEKRDETLDKLRKKYTPKLAALEERIRKADARVAREQAQVKQQGFQTAVSFGATILGALFGRKKSSVGNVGRAAGALRGAGRTAKERGDVARAKEDAAALRERLAALEADFQGELETVRAEADVDALELETLEIKPRKSDTLVHHCGLVWLPYAVAPNGASEPLFKL